MMWSQGQIDSQGIPTFQFSKETVTDNSTISSCKHCTKIAGCYSMLTSTFTSLRRLLTNSISSVSTGLPRWLNASCGKMSCTEAQFFCAFGCKQQHSASVTFVLCMWIVDVHVHVADYYVHWFRERGICQPGRLSTLRCFDLTYYHGWTVQMAMEDQLLLTLMKLRLNVPMLDVAVWFGVTEWLWPTFSKWSYVQCMKFF